MTTLCVSPAVVSKRVWSKVQKASAFRIPVRSTTAAAAAAAHEQPISSQAPHQQPTFTTSLMQTPTILYSSNHLLVVNKPPGWKSVPNQTTNKKHKDDTNNDLNFEYNTTTTQEQRSLLHYLIHTLRAGGGSQHQFLLPLHRLDQPCSGVMLFGKTRKAAARIQPNWKFVQKTYLAVVEQQGLEQLLLHHRLLLLTDEANNRQTQEWRELCGIRRGKRPPRNDENGKSSRSHNNNNNNKTSSNQSSNIGWSVVMQPCQPPPSTTTTTTTNDERTKNSNIICSLEWRVVATTTNNINKGVASTTKTRTTETINYPLPADFCLLEIRTNQGSRHLIRALFAAHGCPLVGDLRYNGNDTTRTTSAAAATATSADHDNTAATAEMIMARLPDRSVALHARSLYLPEDKIRLHNLTERSFTAPIPPLWESLFGFDESSVLLN